MNAGRPTFSGGPASPLPPLPSAPSLGRGIRDRRSNLPYPSMRHDHRRAALYYDDINLDPLL